MLKEHAELTNTGVFCLNAPAKGLQAVEKKTLLVLGAPRGGTSAIAGALSAMGIFMGRGASAPVFESLALSNAIENDRKDQVRDLVDEFNSAHDVWAYKRPGFTRFVNEFHEFFRNPVYLVILRDPVATASRSFLSGRLKLNYLKKLRKVIAVYEGIVDFIDSSGAPTLFISYEKLLHDPAGTLAILGEELGLHLSAEDIALGARFIEPSPEHYLEVSRAERIEGEWETFNRNTIAGWAKYVNKTMTIPPKVTLFQGEQPLATVSADSPHSIAKDKNETPTNCGFNISLETLNITDWKSLRLRVDGDIRDFVAPSFEDSHWWQKLLNKAPDNG